MNDIDAVAMVPFMVEFGECDSAFCFRRTDHTYIVRGRKEVDGSSRGTMCTQTKLSLELGIVISATPTALQSKHR